MSARWMAESLGAVIVSLLTVAASHHGTAAGVFVGVVTARAYMDLVRRIK